jgi:hypothetical protein
MPGGKEAERRAAWDEARAAFDVAYGEYRRLLELAGGVEE